MDLRKRWKRIAVWAVAVVVAIQLVPVWLWHSNPPVLKEPTWDAPRTRALAQAACFDCHSNLTRWPVYSKIAPVSWLVTWDVRAGRGELNFTEWGLGRAEDSKRAGAAESVRQVRRGEMPPGIYTMMHPAARLDAAARAELIKGLEASLAAPAAAAASGGEGARER